jgi:F-type H+-transporting ATPase subunit b
MDQLIHAFGIDAKLIVVQIVNFIILTVILTYFLYRPVLKVLADRKATIDQGIKDAEAAASAKATAETEKQSILTAAQQEAEAVSGRAAKHAEEKAASIVAAADEKACGIITAAEQKAVETQQKALKDSEAEITKLAVLAAEKVMRERAS